MSSLSRMTTSLLAQPLQLGKQSEAQGAIGSVVTALLIGDQSQRRRQINHRLGQGDPQKQAHLSAAWRQGRVRVQAGQLSWRGQGTCRHGVQGPPLSG
jgi:hypothetical protein